MTEHIEANINDICKTVIMPGDPMRAKYIAENYLSDYRLVNGVRGMYAYTGKYKGREITVMAHGMGIPSMGIYSYELFKFYDVDNIIRIGTAGAYSGELNLYDLVLVRNCYSDSNYAKTQNGYDGNVIDSSKNLNDLIMNEAEEVGYNIQYATVHCTDVLYKENENFKEIYDKYGCVAGEMESFALFHNARVLGKNASCILTISNSLVTNQVTNSEEREKNFNDMIILALESAIRL